MDATKAMSILNRACPYLARTGLSALEGMAARGVSTSAVDQARCSVCPGHTGQSALLAKASECPVVGPSIRAKDATAASASMVIPAACPYASCKPTVSENVSAAGTSAASAAAASTAEAVAVTAGPASHSSREAKFDYEGLYQSKLAKKHADKSYRYFNNINRLAMRYPQAHTANASNIVT
ncbi:mitochondrial 5-aminolevulinate synthase, partial [Coemansia sp. RSA 486]